MTEERSIPNRARELMMRALDAEASPDEVGELERLLAAQPALRDELERLSRVKEVTGTMSLRKPPEETWDAYWNSVYSLLERGVAWILVSLGAIAVGSYGAWIGVRDLLADAELPWFVKVGTLALIVGLVILLVSVIRHRVFVSRSDPYRGIER